MTNYPGRKTMNTKPKIERKVLKVFGRVIRPANWLMFLLGVFFVLMAFFQFIFRQIAFIDFLILLATGLALAGQGYGEIKDDEDL